MYVRTALADVLRSIVNRMTDMQVSTKQRKVVVVVVVVVVENCFKSKL